MTLVRHQLLYGLRILSELPLHQDRWIDDCTPPDVIIRMGDTMPFTDERPEGRVLLDFELGRRMYCATVTEDDTHVLRCHRVCDFVIESDLRHVTVRLVEGADPDLASVLATGTLASFLLVLRGKVVLHASAVQVGDQAVAFVGRSGMGKSTMAALLCAEGAKLITDDVLRLDLEDEGPPSCHLGATELRLRKAAGHLAARFDDEVSSRRTVDERDALRLSGAVTAELPLAGIFIPVPEHDADFTRPRVERLDTMEALLTLLRFPRILGWQDQATIDRHFHELGEVVRRVPIHRARMPWGPPFPDGISRLVLEAVGIDGSRQFDQRPTPASAVVTPPPH